MTNKYLEGVSVVAQGAREQAVKIVNLNLANISNLLKIYHAKWKQSEKIPKPLDPPPPPPPPGTFRNKNVTFGQKRRIFRAKNNDHQNFT